jgi:hypothetical protein
MSGMYWLDLLGIFWHDVFSKTLRLLVLLQYIMLIAGIKGP